MEILCKQKNKKIKLYFKMRIKNKAVERRVPINKIKRWGSKTSLILFYRVFIAYLYEI